MSGNYIFFYYYRERQALVSVGFGILLDEDSNPPADPSRTGGLPLATCPDTAGCTYFKPQRIAHRVQPDGCGTLRRRSHGITAGDMSPTLTPTPVSNRKSLISRSSIRQQISTRYEPKKHRSIDEASTESTPFVAATTLKRFE